MTRTALWSRQRARASASSRTVVALTALDLHELGDQLPPAAVEEIIDSLALCLKAKAGATLPIRRDAEVRDEATLGHLRSSERALKGM